MTSSMDFMHSLTLEQQEELLHYHLDTSGWGGDIPPPTDADAPPERADNTPDYAYYNSYTPQVYADGCASFAPYEDELPPLVDDFASYEDYASCNDAPPHGDEGAPSERADNAPDYGYYDGYAATTVQAAMPAPPAQPPADIHCTYYPAPDDEPPVLDDEYYENANYDDVPAQGDTADSTYPWVVQKRNGDTDICPSDFVDWFAKAFDMRYVLGRFYAADNPVPEDSIKRYIYHCIKPHVKISAQRVSSILALLAIETECPSPRLNGDSIYFANCTFRLTYQAPTAQPAIILRKHAEEPVCFSRVPHEFDATVGEPTRLLAFLDELFHPDDIPTLQEYLGYCLMPNTKAQKALFIIGKGGEGKSRLTVLMKLVLGEGAVVSSVGKIGDRFFNATLEERLLFIDDDLQSAKFNETDTFKSLVTNETDILVEAKGKPHYEIRPYVRFLMMGKQSVGSLHDRSHGFYRRVHIINTLPAPKGRQNDPDLIQNIWEAEKAAILLWLVKGALRLVRQNYRLTESAASKQALAQLKEDDNTALSFLKEQTFVYGSGHSVTSSQLTAKYKDWCFDNDLFKVSGQTFKQVCEDYFAREGGGRYSNAVTTGLGKVRGYLGVAFSYA